MLDPARISDLDRILGRVDDTVPKALRKFHQTCKAQGFTDEQSFQLTVNMFRGLLAVPSAPELPQPAPGGGG